MFKKNIVSKSEFILFAVIAVYCVFVSFINNQFLSFSTIFDFLRSSSGTLIVAMGVLVVLLSGGIDISFMAVSLFGGYTTVYTMIHCGINNIFFAFAFAIIIGITLGLFNACIIHGLKLPTFIATLGTQNIFHAVMTTCISDKTYGAGVMPSSISAFGSAQMFSIETAFGIMGLSYFIIPAVISVVLTWFIIYKTMLGRGIVALGNSEESALRAGFNPLVIRLFVYSFMGALAAVMGVVYVAQVNAAYPNALIGNELMVIASVVIGGAKISGGKGKLLGSILGVLIIYLLNSTLILIGLSASWNKFFVGAIILISIAVTSYQDRVKNRKLLIFTE